MKAKNINDVTDDMDEGTDSFKSYMEYNKVLRTWFVAFGIGGPALLLVNEKIAQRLAEAKSLRLIASLFLVGAAAQVLGAFINKTVNWFVYRGAIDEGTSPSCCCKLAEKIADQFWIDILLDIITIGCFGWATWKMLCVLCPVC